MPKNSCKFSSNKDRESPATRCRGIFFSCLFCYCPLYALGRSCGGNFNYLKDGTKCCDACIVPHTNGGYEYVLGKYGEIKKIAERG